MRAFVLSCSALALGATAGCAPIQSFRPAGALVDGKTAEIGAGSSVLGPRPYVDEKARGVGQLWVSKQVRKRIMLSGMGAFDVAAAALGGGLRVDVVRTSRVFASVEGELGFAWAAVLLPASVRLGSGALLYTGPRLGTRGATWALDVPLGISAPLSAGWVLRAEYASSWGELKNYQHRHSLGMAVAYQF